MSSSPSVSVGAAVPVKRKSRMPARLDFLQSASGLALGLFMWGHMFFVSSILLGKDAMWTITQFFEGYFFFGRAYPGIVSFVVAAVIVLFVGHAFARRAQVPDQLRGSARSFRAPHGASCSTRTRRSGSGRSSPDSRCSSSPRSHLYVMLTHPGMIGPYESADRVWSDVLLAALPRAAARRRDPRRHRAVPPRASSGAGSAAPTPDASRRRLKILKWALTVFFLVLGLATLAAYIKIGIEHAPNYGETLRPGVGARRARRRHDEDRLHGRAGHRRRPRRAARGDRAPSGAATTAIILSLVPPKRSHSKAAQGGMQASARQRHQGPGRQRGRPLRGHGARQRLGRRPGSGAHVRQHRAQGGARARRMGRAVEPRAQGRPRGRHQRPER